MTVTTETFETGNRLAAAEKYLGNTKYWQRVKEASGLWKDGYWEKAKKVLDSLPDEDQLLKSLVEKLRNKSVYKTLKLIEGGKLKEGPRFLKGLFSLGTHVAIEVEKGHLEYKMLYPVIYEKLGEMMYRE